jgi:trehalose/maltose hydrolase-like predicted phosphorylase
MTPPSPRLVRDVGARGDRLRVIEDHTFEALVFDWDGTAVPHRHCDAAAVRQRVEALCAAGVHVVVVSGTNVDNVDGQLRARPSGPGRLHLCLNRGSEVYEVTAGGPALRSRREATDEEDRALDHIASNVAAQLRRRGLDVDVVGARMNRRKVDLIPRPEWKDPPKAKLDALLHAVQVRLHDHGLTGLRDVVDIATDAARSSGLALARVTSDVKHVEIGLTDKSDSARWAAGWLAARGVTGSLVLVAGDEFGDLGGVAGSDAQMRVPEFDRAVTVSVGVEPGGTPDGVLHARGGPERFLALLDRQLQRRRDRRVPDIDADPAWVLELPATVALERVAESLGTLANGHVGTRAAREDLDAGAAPLVLASGVYDDAGSVHLLAGPDWTSLECHVEGGPPSRRLDLRTGVLHREGPFRSLRFVSAARPGALGLRAEAAAGTLGGDAPGDRVWAASGGRSGIVIAARDVRTEFDGMCAIQRLASCTADPARPPAVVDAERALDRLVEADFDRLLAEHRAAWAQRWADADVAITGSPGDELAARFAVFHLLSSVAGAGEAAVGARGLSGPAYGGHVFWDADVFVLPSIAALHPEAARAMLEYRIRRLPAAREAATAAGRRGARFPWESAGDGRDVTPRQGQGPHGLPVQILTGDREEHIVADVAWAACEYTNWTGDDAFLVGPGRDLVLDTARYWASRIEMDGDGRGHLLDVIGPDEYHTIVDDNAFTNVMARWNLRRAAALGVATGADPAEAAQWRRLADALVDGYDSERGLYEQFAAYWSLEPLLAAHIAPPPIAADVVLGAERIAGSQVSKQVDVCMLHHLVPDDVVPGSLHANLAFYEPRTAHGSSLSPAISAALLARANRPDDALGLFRLAARMDLDDLTGTTAGGLHLAAMGGVWQALAYGFLGLRPRDGALDVDPHLPGAWTALSLTFRFHGARVTVRSTHDDVTIACGVPTVVRMAGATVHCDPPGRTFPLPKEAR